ncbi:unnamed protein product [Rhodiola kirilowii]
MDVEFKDVNGNHVGIDVNSMVSKQTADLGVSGIDLKSGNLINAWVEFDGVSQMLNVSRFRVVGFSGSTQGSTEMHSIEWWSFTSSFESNHDGSVSAPSPPAAELVVPSAYFFNSTATPPSPPPADSHASTRRVSQVPLLAATSCVNKVQKVKRVKKMDTLGSDVIKMPKVFTYKDLKAATKCFDSSRIIGHGAFGVVYRGVMTESGDIVAVKRCSHNSQGKNEFLSELSIIGSLRHRNLVRLQGWCHEKGEILLVYDLMPNGSLDKALFEARTPLPWYHRQRILMGVASALAYLHQECENQVIHRDVKTSNIMLDEGFRARLGDFGLARQVEHDKSPEATLRSGGIGSREWQTSRSRRKQVGLGKSGAGGNLVEWVWSLHRDGKLLTAADDKLRGEFDEAEMRKVLLVGLICSHPDPSARPTMRAVVQMLAGEAEVPIVPRTRPSLTFSTSHLLLSLQDSVSDYNGIISLSSYSSENSYIGGDELV